MFRMMCGLCGCVLLSSFGLGQTPAGVKSGAQFVWELVNLDSPQQCEKYFSDREVIDRIHAELRFEEIKADALKSIFDEKQHLATKLRGATKKDMFNTVVTYCKSDPVDINVGNQYVLYQVETKADDVMFIRLHLKGKTSLVIDEIQLVPIRDAIKEISKRYLRIDVEVQENN